MSRKSLILCVSVLGIFLIIVAASLYFLYSGTGESKDSIADSREYMLLAAVPSDADAVLRFEDLGTLMDCLSPERSAFGYFLLQCIRT